MRLDKYLAHSMGITRSGVKEIIKNGVVEVNDKKAGKPEMKVDEVRDKISVNGAEMRYKQYVYLMMNKPKGYVSAVWDKHYKTVTELVDDKYAYYGVFPVGRLDIDTEGLLILTNDGDFTHRLTSPKKNVYKKYFARLSAAADESDIEAFRRGMEFKEFTAKSAILEITENPCEVYIHIAEGKFHQVKRMCERVGKSVEYLKRVSIGGLCLDDRLQLGESRELTEEEIELIFK